VRFQRSSGPFSRIIVGSSQRLWPSGVQVFLVIIIIKVVDIDLSGLFILSIQDNVDVLALVSRFVDYLFRSKFHSFEIIRNFSQVKPCPEPKLRNIFQKGNESFELRALNDTERFLVVFFIHNRKKAARVTVNSGTSWLVVQQCSLSERISRRKISDRPEIISIDMINHKSNY
jgi:hypothetical protein